MWRISLIVILLVGIAFHLINIDKKVYWFDEVYTSFRVSGYQSQEIDNEIFQDKIITKNDLNKFISPKPHSKVIDTIQSLAQEDAQHPPLYFIINYFWNQFFGNSILAYRSLAVLFSLLCLPFMYKLAQELFNSRLTAIFATIFLAWSPVDILFAQTARQYSLLSLLIISSSYFLIKAIKNDKIIDWILYSIFCIFGLYTHPFFILIIMGHGGFIISRYWIQKNQQYIKNIQSFIFAIALSIIFYLPWIWIIIKQKSTINSTTNWASQGKDLVYLLKLWILSFSSLIFDLDFGFNNFLTYLVRLAFITVIALALWQILSKAKIETKLFILATFLIPFLSLAIPDLVLGGIRSATTRYLIPCFPAIQLALAYLFVSYQNLLSRIILGLLITSSLISVTMSAMSYTWWSKGVSYFNYEQAKIINNTNRPLIISDHGSDYLNKGNLISLSLLVKDNTRFFLLSYPPKAKKINSNLLNFQDYNKFLLSPSHSLKNTVKAQCGKDSLTIAIEGLWKISCSSFNFKQNFSNSK